MSMFINQIIIFALLDTCTLRFTIQWDKRVYLRADICLEYKYTDTQSAKIYRVQKYTDTQSAKIYRHTEHTTLRQEGGGFEPAVCQTQRQGEGLRNKLWGHHEDLEKTVDFTWVKGFGIRQHDLRDLNVEERRRRAHKLSKKRSPQTLNQESIVSNSQQHQLDDDDNDCRLFKHSVAMYKSHSQHSKAVKGKKPKK